MPSLFKHKKEGTVVHVRLLVILGFALVSWTLPDPLLAEDYFDVYGGGMFSASSSQKYRGDFQSSLPSFLTPGSTVNFSFSSSDVKMDPSFTGGIRTGRWADNFGFGVDLFYFQLKSAEQTVPGNSSFDSRSPVPGGTVSTRSSQVDFPKTMIHVIGLTVDVRARLRLLQDETYKNGRIQPYLGIAPGVFYGIIDDPDTRTYLKIV
jgi:hypothetical protein